MPINMTYVGNTTNPMQLIGGLNIASDGILGMIILLVVFFTIVVSLKGRGFDIRDALAAASVVNLILTVLFYFSAPVLGLALIGGRYVIFSVSLFLGMMFYYLLHQ